MLRFVVRELIPDVCALASAAQYPCAVLSPSNQDYGGGDLERNPRYGTNVDACTALCVQTAKCEGFALKTDGRCYLKDNSFNPFLQDIYKCSLLIQLVCEAMWRCLDTYKLESCHLIWDLTDPGLRRSND